MGKFEMEIGIIKRKSSFRGGINETK